MASARAAFCSTSINVYPARFISPSLSKISVTNFGESPSEGSSSRIRRGAVMSARPIASICCSPPDSVPAFWRRRSKRTGNSSYTRASAAATRAGSATVYAPISRFSSTVIWGKTSRPCGTYARPRRSTRSGRIPVISSPLKTTRPLFGRRNPTIVLNAVAFPAPLGPITVTISPTPTLSETQDVDRAVAPDELVGGEELRAHTAARVRHGSATEVRFDDALVGLDHARRPLGDLLAVVQHEHGLAEPHDDLHVVLDEQDGLAAVAELTDGLEEVVEEGPVHARGGLVEEDERRVPHQHANELEELLLAVREVPRVLVTESVELHEAQQPERALAGCGEAVACDDEKIFQGRELGEDADDLEGPADPLLRDLPGPEAVHALAAEVHPPLVQALHARHAVEKRRLARAVGPDQAVDPGRLEPERNAVHSRDAAEALPETLDLEHGRRRHQVRWSGAAGT